MNNFRLRFQVLFIVSAVLHAGLVSLTNFFPVDPQKAAFSEIWDMVAGGLFLTFGVIVLIDSVLSGHYLKSITTLHTNLDKRTLLALRDASVFRLRKLAVAADRIMVDTIRKVDDILKRSAVHANLQGDKSFLKAVYGFNFEKAEAMIARAERAEKYASEMKFRKESRQQGRMESLVEEGRSLGFSDGQMSSMNPTSLRALIEDTKERNVLCERAVQLGCSTYVEQLIEDSKSTEAKTFLLRAEVLLKEARTFGIESAVREFIAYGNLPSAETLISAKKNDSKFLSLVSQMESEIQKAPEPNRPALNKLLGVFRGMPYPSRESNKALHDLEVALDRCKA